MDINHGEACAKVITNLSALIFNNLRSHQLERHHPGSNPDRMDDLIKATGERHAVLTRLRDEFEREMAKPV